MGNEKCPLCNNFCQRSHDLHEGLELVDCPICGKYLATMEAIDDFADLNNAKGVEKKIIISAITRNRSEINPKNLVKLHSYNIDEIESLVATGIPKTVPEKFNHLLLFLNQKTTFGGKSIKLQSETDFPIAFCKNEAEFDYLLRYLEEEGYVQKEAQIHYELTFSGFKKAEELLSNKPKGDQCFVAMSFAKELECVRDHGILKAIKETKWKPKIVNLEEFIDKIDDKIMSEIRKSSLIVVDVTLHRQSVYFEAGFAMGSGIPVIWTCNETYIDAEEAAFDTRQYNHIVWATPDELYEKLLNRINALYPREI